MSSRWFIPASLAIFGGFIAAIWLYLAATQEPPAPVLVTASPSILVDAELESLIGRRSAAESTAAQKTAVKTTSATPRSRRARAGPSLWNQVSKVAERLDETSVHFRNSIADTAIVRTGRGVNEAAAGNQQAALRHFDLALARNPRDTAALSAKADSLVALERFEEAAEVYQEVARLAPRDTASRYNYAVVLWRLSRFDDAARELREVVRQNPDHADAQYNLASLAQRDGRINEARAAWEAFTRLRPQVATGWFNLGVVDMDFDEPKKAAEAFARFTSLSPADPGGWINLALAESASGRPEYALYALTIANDLSPCEGLTMDLLAQVHEMLALQNPDEAEMHRTAAMEIYDVIGRPKPESEAPVATIAAGEKN